MFLIFQNQNVLGVVVCVTDVSVKPFPVQNSICLLIRPFNHPDNIGNTSLHPSLSYTIVLIIFNNSFNLNIMIKVYVLLFHCFTVRTGSVI